MAKVEMIAPNFLGSVSNRKASDKEKLKITNYLNTYSNNYGINNSIESLLIKINSVTSYEEIPDCVRFCYKNIIERNLDFKLTLNVVDLTAKLAAAKFNKKPKEIRFTGFHSDNSIALDDHYEKIVSAGFVGCSVSPMVYGIEAAEEHSRKAKKDPAYWSPVVLSGKKIIVTKLSPLEITLTFRQEQILQLILKGMTNYQIAKRLNLSESTIKMHIGIIFKKYAVQDRIQLIFSLKEKLAN